MGNAKRSGALAAVAAAVVCLREWREGDAIAAAGYGSASAQRRAAQLTAGLHGRVPFFGLKKVPEPAGDWLLLLQSARARIAADSVSDLLSQLTCAPDDSFFKSAG